MAERISTFDWSKTPVGPMEQWPQSLCTAVRMILGSRYPMFIWWGEHLLKFYNDAYVPILGQRHPAALGQPAARTWSEIWDVVGAQADLVVQGGQSTWNEELLLVMQRNGYPEETYFTFSYSPVMDDSGAINGVFCACTEDTARVLSARRLRTLRELAAETAAAATVAEVCSVAGDILTKNQHDLPFVLFYLRDHGAGVARLMQAVGLEAEGQLAPTDVSLTEESAGIWPLARALSEPAGFVLTEELAALPALPGGPWPEPCRRVAIQALSEAGQEKAAGFLVIGLSPRLEYDDDYRGFITLLTRSVATAVDNVRAHEAERDRSEGLARLNRAKSTFFSNVSHEFRTPLTLLLGPLEDLQTKLAAIAVDGVKESLSLMQRNALRLQKMVNTLLDFSKLEAGAVALKPEPVDLSRFTTDLASVFRSATERAGLWLRVDCPPLSGPIEVDVEMWEKIVLNLLSNALKFTTDGGIDVVLHESSGGVQLTVTDTGIGLPPDELPRVFERFYRVESRSVRTHEGTGIGLSLVQELVQMHHGTVNVQSTEGSGTAFTVWIPRAQTTSVKPTSSSAAAPFNRLGSQRAHYLAEVEGWLMPANDPGSGDIAHPSRFSSPQPIGPRPRVLLADDNTDMREYAARLLSEHFEVEAVSNGREALQAIAKQVPDCVVTDVMMPAMDGFELLSALRAAPEISALPVVMLSARAGEEARLEGLEAGADAYLVKPFSARELFVTVTGRIEIARLRAEATERERRLRSDVDVARRDAITILESITDPFYALDHDLRFVYLNRAFERLTNRTRDSLVGLSIIETYPEVKGSIFETKFRQALKEQKPIHFEAASLTSEDWLEVHAYPSADRVAITFRDISARQAAIKESLFVASLNDILRTSKTPSEVLDRSAKHVAEQFKVVRCCYARLDQSGEYAIVDQEYAKGVVSIVGRHHISAFGQRVEEQIRRGETLALADVWQDPRCTDAVALNSFAALQTRATLVVPVVKEGNLVSLFVLGHHEPRLWSADDIHYAEQATERIWLAFEAASTAQALREREERLRLAARATNDAIWDWDLQSRTVEWNEAIAQLFGFELRDVPAKGSWWADHIHSADRERVLKGIWAAINGSGENWSDEYRFLRADGSEAYVFDRGYVLRDGQGKGIRMIGAMQDLTARRKSEEALRASEQRFRAVFNQQFQFIALLSPTGVTLEINELPLRTAGYTREQLIGEVFWESPFWIPLPEMQREWPRRLATAAASDGPVLSEDQYATVSGEIRFADAAITAVRNPDGNVEFYIVQANDTTERRLAEAERDKLLQSLRANDRRKDEFLAMLAHELRNPLAAIRSAVSLIGASKSPQDRQWSDDVIARQVRQLARLVDDLLDVSRITQDKIRLQREYIDAISVLERAVEVVRPLVLERGHRLTVRYDRATTALPLHVDPTRLEQIVVNLLTNSAKYTERGGQIELAAHLDQDTGDNGAPPWVVISVRDNGIGIPPDLLTEMFELFAQGERSMARSEGGLGLGLTIVRKLVEMHGGSVMATSEGLGKGSTFTVRFRSVEPTPDSAAMSSGLSTESEAAVYRGVDVLIVDDNRDTADGLGRLLKLSGHQVHVAYDGLHAATLARELKPQFILLDIGLPGKDGYEVAREIRNHEESRSAVLIAISGYGQDDDLRASQTAGFDHHLVKPVDIEQLKELLQS